MSSYIDRVLRTQSSSFAGYWPLNDESGTVALDWSKADNNATSASLMRKPADRDFLAPDGSKCAKFDGTASVVNFYTATSTAIETEGSMSIWVATPTAKLKGTTLMQIVKMGADANNLIDITFDTTAYRFSGIYTGNSTSDTIVSPLVYNTAYGADWHHFVMTWSKTAEALNFYVDSVAQTAAATLGVFTGNFAATLMCLGASSTTVADLFTGWLSHFALWNGAILSQSEVDDLYKIGL